MESGEVSGAGEASGPEANPAGRPGMGVDYLDIFQSDNSDQIADIQKPPKQAPVVDGNGENAGLCRVGKFTRGNPNPVAVFDLPINDRGCGRFRSRHKITTQNMKNIHRNSVFKMKIVS